MAAGITSWMEKFKLDKRKHTIADMLYYDDEMMMMKMVAEMREMPGIALQATQGVWETDCRRCLK